MVQKFKVLILHDICFDFDFFCYPILPYSFAETKHGILQNNTRGVRHTHYSAVMQSKGGRSIGSDSSCKTRLFNEKSLLIIS